MFSYALEQGLSAFGGWMTLSQGSPKTIENIDIYIVIHNCSKITITK